MEEKSYDLKKELHALVRTDASLFKFLQDGAFDGIWYWDLERPQSGWISARFWSLLGYGSEEMVHLASRWQELIHPDDRQSILQAVTRRCDPTDPCELILRCLHKNGSTVWVRCRALVIRNKKERSDRALGTLADMTSQKVAEQNLKRSENFLEAVFDSIQDGISILDRELNIISVNRTMERWYPEMLPLEGKKCFQAYHGKRETCKLCPTSRAIKSGNLEMDEIPLVRMGAEVGTLELFAFPMLNKSGETEAVVEYVRDITERKRAEALLKERELLFRSLYENNYSMILLIDPDTGDIVDANPAACAFYGYPKKTFAQMKITDLQTLSQEAVFEEMKNAKAEDRNHFIFQHQLSDGSVRDVEVFSGPITFGGKSLLCSIIHDISKRKKMERNKQRLIEKLQKALTEVKTLRGFIPICSSCKKIRDDQGYWNQIESYIRKHSEAEFSHGICPECARKLYPGLNMELTPEK